MDCSVVDGGHRVNVIRDGNQMKIPFSELKANDVACLPNGVNICIGEDAHISGDATYEGWLVYDDHGNSYFPEDFECDSHETCEGALERCMSAIFGQLPKCPAQARHGFWTDGNVIFCHSKSAAEAVANFLEALGVESATDGLSEFVGSDAENTGSYCYIGMEY